LDRTAERKRLISRNPFIEVDFLKAKTPRQPHIVTFDEEERILTAATPFLRALIVLILETGLRSHREALTPEMGSRQLRERFCSGSGIENPSGHPIDSSDHQM